MAHEEVGPAESEELLRACALAHTRALASPAGIGAAFVTEHRTPDMRGRWYAQVAVDDGTDKHLSVLVGLSADATVRDDATVNEERVAALLEDIAIGMPGENKLKDLLYATAEGPGILLDVLRPDDYRSIFD